MQCIHVLLNQHLKYPFFSCYYDSSNILNNGYYVFIIGNSYKYRTYISGRDNKFSFNIFFLGIFLTYYINYARVGSYERGIDSNKPSYNTNSHSHEFSPWKSLCTGALTCTRWNLWKFCGSKDINSTKYSMS